MNQLFKYTNIDYFLEQEVIESGPFSDTILTSHKETKEKYAQRYVTIEHEELTEKFQSICDRLFQMQYPCSLRPSYASLPDSTNKIPPALYVPYAENKSLKDIIQRLEKGELIEDFDITQSLIIIHGILLFLNAMHSDDLLHGRLKISNILLDSQFYPLVSDSFLYHLNAEKPLNDLNIKMLDYVVSLPPEVITHKNYSSKSDIYSFGIIMLQILTHQINIYSDFTDDCFEILQIKQNGQLPNIPEIQNQLLHDLIYQCLDFDPNKRPTAQELLENIEKIGTDNHRYDIQRLNKFKSIHNSTNEITNPKVSQMKKLADEGNIQMMYEYGRARFLGENCSIDLTESMKYISNAAKLGNENAQSLLKTLHSEIASKFDTNKPEIEEDQAPIIQQQKIVTNNKIHLKDDPFFTRKKADIPVIINEVKNNYKKTKMQKFDQLKLGKKSFIFTDGAIKRLTKLYNYLESGVPVLLEGPTGTSKTLSSEIVCQLREQPLLRFNLSSETKASYLLGRYKGDINSWAGISMSFGVFIEAYKNGYTLLLDEINLASPECLQFIEEALDSGKISIEIPGMPLEEIEMHQNFRLIATQNPNKGLFANKRHDLDTKFLSRFQVINFPSFDENEYTKIAEGLASSFDYEAPKGYIHDLVRFHMDWSSREDIKGDVQCFTVREIAATVRALADGRNLYDTIMTIYGARYQKDKKENLRKLFLSKNSFKNLKPTEFTYPENFPECYHNKSLEEALKAIFFSFDNNRNVILTGVEGSGITQVAKWVAQYYDKKNKSDQENLNEGHEQNDACNNNTDFFCVCTEEIKCSDLIGHQKPSDKIDSGQELITFKPGLLTEGISQGKCVVLDSLDEAPSTVTERLNGLLDEKYDGEKKMFEIPENPQGLPIEINPNFRLLCTCRIDKLSQMSPAFINRFDVVVLENQLENIADDKLKELIELLMKIKLSSVDQAINQPSNEKDDKKDINNEISQPKLGKIQEFPEEEDDDDDDEDLSWGDDDMNDEDDAQTAGTSIQQNDQEKNNLSKEINIIEFKPSSDLVKLVLKRFDKSLTIFKLSQLCKSVSKLVQFFSTNSTNEESHISNEEIVKFATNLLMKTEDFSIPSTIENFLIKHLLKTKVDDDGQYFFKDSAPLRSFMSKLFAASIINLPVCVYGATGVGKTSAARAFAKMRTNLHNRKIPFLMHSFHAGTKPNHFYGTTTIKNSRVVFINGTLTTSLQDGCTFIADEMNLSTISTMKSLAPALEPCIREKIFIPGVGETATIHPDFFFIACQNELGTIGRNVIPSSIASRFRILYYPIQQESDISSICYDISKSFYSSKDSQIKPSFSDDEAYKIGKYMIKLNQEKQKVIPQWSLRDITKIFRRIRHQDELPNNYNNLRFVHNILFYTLAPVSKSELKGIFNSILKLIGDTFVLSVDQRNELKDCYLGTPYMKNIQGKGCYLMKGKTGINTELFPNFKEYQVYFAGLPSLLDSIFHVLLSDSTEPILLMGPSGFKTFLSKLYLQNAKVIALNQETTVSQLMGTSAFLTKSEAKHFYLDLICKMCHIYDSEIIATLKEKLSNNRLELSDITKRTKDYIPFVPSFAYAINHLTDKLFDDSINENNENVLSDMIIEFRPGLFLLPILQGESLILKNLSNLPTIILERFNELFSGKHNLTLNEDFHNTFTSSEQKELTDFSSTFRAFATSPPNTAAKLSEAVLSRFTVINTPEYKSEEQGTVLKSYNKIYKKNLPDEIIELIIEFSKSIQSHLKKTLSFTQLINILEICSRLISSSSSSPKMILGIILYRVFVGLLDRRNEYKEKIKIVFNEINITLPEPILNPINESPFIIANKNGFEGLASIITGLFIHSTNVKEVNSNIAFTPPFIDMLDIIHLGISANVPVILEGNAGQGKQKAIQYFAQHLGYDIINIVISKSTKVDDLLGKVTIEPDERNNIHVKTNFTKLAKAIESNSNISNSIFVFHNLNNASPAVLEKLSSLFDRSQSEFSLPDGTTHPKGQINVIGIFNPQNGISNREKLPTSLIYSSIYHIVDNPKKYDVLKIIEVLFKPTEFKFEVVSFFEKYKITKKFALQNNASSAVTLYDINKYILFRNVTNGFFKEELIYQMLFGYRFLQQETINQVLKELKLIKMVFQPKFIFNEDKKEIYIKESDDSNGLALKIHKNSIVDTEKIKSALRSLTLAQQQCLLFLACSVLSKRACIVQGSTASGKSHIIRLFADMLGQKLNVYQMNSDTGMSILTGQSVLLNEISEKDKNEFNVAFSDLQSFSELREYIDENFSIPYNEWKPKQFSDLLALISKYRNENELSNEKRELLHRGEAKIKQTMSPAKRFHHEESTFIRSLEKGEWVLIDGIESAPQEIAEKFSSLCGDDPEIDLFECGENSFFSRDKPNSRRIHDNFQLFVTYNPSSKIGSRTLDSNFLNKCISFTLPAIDSTPNSSAQVLVGSLLNYKYDNDFASDIGKRFANAHQFAKNDSETNRDSYAGDIQFTGRTLTFILKEFNRNIKKNDNSIKKIYKVICRSLQSYYWNSIINKNKEEEIKSKMIDKLFEQPEQKDFNINYQGIDDKEKYENLLIDLRNIQLFVCKEKSDLNFDFKDFIKKCFDVRLTGISFIFDHIDDTINIIKENCSIKNEETWAIYENLYSQLSIILNIFQSFKEGMKSINPQYLNLSLNSDDLQTFNNFEQPISRMRLLQKLNEKSFFCQSIPYILYDDDFLNLFKLANEMAQEYNINQFYQFISKLHENKKLIPKIEEFFPYHLFKNKKHPFHMIIYWIPMFRKLYDNKLTFHIVCNQTYDFEFPENYCIEPTYIFKEDNSLCLSTGSKLLFTEENGKMLSIPEKSSRESWSKVLYGLTDLIFSDGPKNYQTFRKSDNLNKYKKSTPPKETNQYPYLSKLYNQDPDDSLVSKIWSMVYNLSPQIIQLLIFSLHPIESDIVKAISSLYYNIDQKQLNSIFEFTRWVSQIGKQQSKLWLIFNNQYEYPQANNIQKIKEERDQLQREINYLKISPILNKKIWMPSVYIDKLQTVKIPFDTAIQNNIKQDKENHVRKQLKELIDNLENTTIKDKDYIILKNEIIHQILQVIEKSPKSKDYDRCSKKVHQFLELLGKNELQLANNIILWPNYIQPKGLQYKASNKIKLYEHVIWFSQVKSIIDRICNPNNKKVFEDVFELSKFTEMQASVQLLMKQLMDVQETENFEINTEDRDSIYSTLNAQFLSKIYFDKLMPYLKTLDKTFNDLALRIQIKDECEIQWIHQKVNQSHPNLNIVLPKFKANDLFYLFVGYSGDNNNCMKGPLISNINCSNLLKSLSRILFTNPKTFIECSDQIAQSIFRFVFPKRDVPENHSEFKVQLDSELKKSRAKNTTKMDKNKEEYQNKQRNESLMTAALSVISISDFLVSIPQSYSFTHEDDAFLKQDWIKNQQFITKYPSFVYWLIKYQKYANSLQKVYSCSELNDKYLPFWLFALRIMSSQNCIMIDIDSSSTVSKLITETINKCIKEFINSRGLSNLGTDWLSLILASVPSEILIPNYRMFYEFLLNLSKDNKKNSELIEKQKSESIVEFTSNVCKMIFNNKGNAFLKKKFLDLSNKNLAFVHDPNNFINKQINNDIKQKFTDFLQSDAFITYQTNASKIEEQLNLKIIQVDETIIKENQSKERRFIEYQREMQIKKLDKLKKDLLQNIQKYNEKIKYIKTSKIKPLSKYSEQVAELINIEKSMPELIKKDDDPLILYQPSWDENVTLKLSSTKKKGKKKNNKFIYLYHSYKDKYFYPALITKKIVKTLENKNYTKFEWKEVKFFMVDEQKNDIDNICTKQMNFYQIDKRIPTLIFGVKNQMQSSDFIQKLYSSNTIFSKLIADVIKCINEDNITDKLFSQSKAIISEFALVSSLLTAQFTDNSECTVLKGMLNDLKIIYSQLDRYAYNFDYLIRDKIYWNWKSLSNMNYVQKLFSIQYQLPFPSQEKIKDTRYSLSFDSVKGVDFLSLPILSVEKNDENEDAISCCFDTLDCSIGPIIPSLYSGKFAMNFISFIDSPISIEIISEDHQELFPSRGIINPGDPVQVFISLPHNPTEKIKDDIPIETKLKVKSTNPNLKELELPCNFIFKLVPLSVLISCEEYPLSYSNDEFYLCAPRIHPNSYLTFTFKNYYVKEPCQKVYQFIDFDDNQANKPDILTNRDDDNLKIYIKSVNDVTKLHFMIKVKFSESLTANILIDSLIIPFEFAFDIYDYKKKQYVNDTTTIYYSPEHLDREINLHCRLYGIFLSKFSASIKNNFAYPLTTVSSPKNLIIQEKTEFDIVLKLQSSISTNYQSRAYSNSTYSSSTYSQVSGYNYPKNDYSYYLNSYYISITIGEIEKKIYLKIEEPKLISQYGNYLNSSYFDIPYVNGYDWRNKKWKLLNSTNYYSNDYVYIVSPFHILNKFSLNKTENSLKVSVPKVSYTTKYSYLHVTYIKIIEVMNSINNKFISAFDNGEIISNQGNKIELGIINRSSKALFGVTDDEWYPIFEEYDQYFQSFTQLEMTEENSNFAKIKLKDMPNPFFCSPTNFLILARLLTGNISFLKNLHDLVSKFPPSFNRNEYNEVLNYLIGVIPALDQNDNILPLIQYNLIFIFYNLFNNRYNEIKKNDGYLFNKMSDTEMQEKSQEAYNLYNQIGNETNNNEIYNETHKKISNIKNLSNEMNLHPQPPEENQFESYLITCESDPKPHPKNDLPELVTHSTSHNSFVTDKTINVKLPTIDIPKESEFNKLSIQSLNKFYQQCTEGTRLLPIYVKNMIITNSSEMKENAKKYFMKLLQIYKPLPNKDYSFIATAVNTFSLSFASMVNKFEKAGVKFNSLVPKKFILNEQNIQGLIQYPEKDQLIISQDIWKSQAPIVSNEHQVNQVLPSGNNLLGKNLTDFVVDNPEVINPDISPSETEKPKSNPSSSPDPKPEKCPSPAEIAYIKQLEDEYTKCREEEDFEIPHSDDEYEESDDDIIEIAPNDGDENDQQIDQESFDGLLSEFTEKDGIDRAIARMKAINPDNPLNIQPYTSHQFKSQYLNPDNKVDINDYPIISLINQSFIISQEFIKIASELDLQYSSFCVNILIDCSTFISDENKIFNMLIICALTDAITTLGIPYSAAVIGDKNFKCIIKPFTEAHSYVALQRICDCLLIKRYRPKLPGCLQFAIKSMGYPDDTRKNRAIFTFTNGLDEHLVITKGWSEIFAYSQISFGFVFIKSSELLIGDNLTFLENVWDNFEKETNGKNSIVKIAKIVADKNLQKPNGEISDVVKTIVELFATVMKRTSKYDEDHITIDRNYKQPIFELSAETQLKTLFNFKQYMSKKYSHIKSIYVQRSDVLKNATSVIDQLDSKQFNNKLNRITVCKIDDSLKKEYPLFIKEYIQNRKNINRGSLETIFKPNKASQTILSSTGTDFDITALILNLINPVPDPLIYLEEKGGLIRNYGITVVIDASYSCFSPLSSSHSFQTIRSVLSSLAVIDLLCFDLVIAAYPSPIVLCSEVKTFYALNERSPLWDSLFAILQNISSNNIRPDLASAIHTAFDLRRMRSLQCTSIMFVLTDGLYQITERPRIVECINNCVQSGMITFGIGMGIYPKGIEKLFPQFVFAGNPSNVMKGVSNLFTDNFYDYSESMFCINSSFDSNETTNAIKRIIDKSDNPLFKSLCNELSNIMPTLDAFSDFINQEQDIGNATKGFINPQGKDTELYIHNFLKTQKILIVHLCDDTVCVDPQLNKKYIFENCIQGRTECINEAVKFFGITLQVVQNYEDAILELTKSQNECCEYYACWIICGRHPEQLPTGQRSSNKYIIEQFIDVLIQFWKNGGSLVFWADNDPFTFQVNVFLSRVRFENEENCPAGKVNFQIHGNHPGCKILVGDDSGNLRQEQIFNRSPQMFEELERTTISHNLAKIYEGATLSYVDGINAKTDSNYKNKIKPFKPFAIDSNGGITSLFYPSNLKTKTGDIVIDCGFSKLFYELKEEGTFRYIQNIAGWTARPEVHLRIDRGKKPCDWRPKAVKYTINNISSPNYGSDIQNLIMRASNNSVNSVIKQNVQKLGGNINGVLRFSIQWNDIGSWDENDLDAHCIEPNGFEIMFSSKVDNSTGGNLDIDITHPSRGEVACENITWSNLNRMPEGTYQFFVHQYAYRNGHSGFRAEIEFENQIFSYDYRSTLLNKTNVYVAYVTLRNGRFSISHKLSHH